MCYIANIGKINKPGQFLVARDTERRFISNESTSTRDTNIQIFPENVFGIGYLNKPDFNYLVITLAFNTHNSVVFCHKPFKWYYFFVRIVQKTIDAPKISF